MNPIIHLNGTSGEELLNQAENAERALREAYDAICKAAPHARDYYVNQDPDAFRKARKAHDGHVDQLNDLITYYSTLAVFLQDQIDERER